MTKAEITYAKITQKLDRHHLMCDRCFKAIFMDEFCKRGQSMLIKQIEASNAVADERAKRAKA